MSLANSYSYRGLFVLLPFHALETGCSGKCKSRADKYMPSQQNPVAYITPWLFTFRYPEFICLISAWISRFYPGQSILLARTRNPSISSPLRSSRPLNWFRSHHEVHQPCYHVPLQPCALTILPHLRSNPQPVHKLNYKLLFLLPLIEADV